MADFICNVKRYRQWKGLAQEQLAEKAGVRRETILRLEAEKYNPSLKLVFDLSRILETPIEDLFSFDQNHPYRYSSQTTRSTGQSMENSEDKQAYFNLLSN